MTAQSASSGHEGASVAAVTTVLVVPGMHCAGCMGKVERALGELPGVSAARVNLSARQVSVTHAAELAMPEMVGALAEAVAEAPP